MVRPASPQSTSPVVAALSGGVDSAVAAAMLVERGHRVVGMTMRLYDASGTAASSGGRCCGPRDIEDARQVCRHLGIPFYVVDLEESFQRGVIDDFVDAYLAGETPNPCARCNQRIKFTPLLQRARALGAERLATGHYARLGRGAAGQPELRRGVDASKDQSYFLFSMPAGELHSIDFPLGDLTKDEVRERALRYGLPNAEKAESQEICFVPDGDYAGFVEASALARGRRSPKEGAIVDGEGRELGRHAGIHRYTIGQRRGLGAIHPGGDPAYVARLDVERNLVVVGDRDAAARRELVVRELQWLVDPPPDKLRAAVQIRHRAAPVACSVEVEEGGRARIELDAPVIASPGQAAVFYADDRVLGGGWIASCP
jgi:tRNA-uridine 2-sulfurtransferase